MRDLVPCGKKTETARKLRSCWIPDAIAAAMTDSVIVRLEKAAIVSVIHQEPAFSEMFIAHLLGRTTRARRFSLELNS
jgi:hypothetical protein